MRLTTFVIFAAALLLHSPWAVAQTVEASDEEGAGEAAQEIVPPSLLEYVQADYPADALREGIQAEVEAMLTIDESGLVTDVEITAPAGHGFDEAAADAMYQFVFSPATADGAPISSRIVYRYKFFFEEKVPEVEPPPEPAALSGVVRDMDGGPLLGASVILVPLAGEDGEAADQGADAGPEELAEERTETTDEEGRFSFGEIPAGAYTVDVVTAGYEPLSVTEELVAGEKREVLYRVTVEAAIYETVVRDRRPPREVTRREITRREITRIPGTGGDALRAVQNMPGMARAPGMSGNLIVRGSAPGDSDVYFDQMPIPLLYHFGGLTSVINSDLLERIDFYPGNFSVRYGNAIGGVVDVYPKAPATDRLHASLGVDVFDVTALVETPIGEDWSVAVSGRRSYIDGIMSAVMPEDGGFEFTVAPRYYDYQLVVDYHPDREAFEPPPECAALASGELTGMAGSGGGGAYLEVPDECKPKTGEDNVRLFAFGSDDKLVFIMGDDVMGNPNFGGGLDFHIYFHQAQLRWDHKFSRGVTNELNIGSGFWGSDTRVGEDYEFNLSQVPIFLRDELAWKAGRFFTFRTGLDTEIDWAEWKIRAPSIFAGEGENTDPITSDEEIIETTGDMWFFRPGWYGEAELNAIDDLTMIYGLRVDFHQAISKVAFDPRLVARYQLFERTTLKGGLGLFHQTPTQAQVDETYGNPDLDLEEAVHYSLGVEQGITKNIELGVEGFYKDFRNLVVSSTDTIERDGEIVDERYNNEGGGSAYGLEFMLKHQPTDRFFGWISYTLMKSTRIDHPGEDSRPFDYDQTHILTVVASLVLGRGWEAGVRFRLVTGNPDTPVTGSVFDSDSDIYLPIYGETNSERLPTFHQLDVRIDKKWQFKHLNFQVYLDIQNAYNRQNVEGYSYAYDYSERVYFYGLPLIPNLGLILEY